jgi:outer membrane protein OmpA-like peptidoglycan-associated protein
MLIRIEGYTGADGGEAYNLRLSDRRAASVKAWLVAKEGFGAGAFRTQGFGAAHPVAPNTKPGGGGDPVGRQRNRRVELLVASTSGASAAGLRRRVESARRRPFRRRLR